MANIKTTNKAVKNPKRKYLINRCYELSFFFDILFSLFPVVDWYNFMLRSSNSTDSSRAIPKALGMRGGRNLATSDYLASHEE